jgi:hypothetical protein
LIKVHHCGDGDTLPTDGPPGKCYVGVKPWVIILL